MGVRFSAPVQIGPGAHPSSHTMGTVSFPGVKRLGRRVDHLPPSSAEIKERVELYLYSPSGPSWSVLGELCLYVYLSDRFHISNTGRLGVKRCLLRGVRFRVQHLYNKRWVACWVMTSH